MKGVEDIPETSLPWSPGRLTLSWSLTTRLSGQLAEVGQQEEEVREAGARATVRLGASHSDLRGGAGQGRHGEAVPDLGHQFEDCWTGGGQVTGGEQQQRQEEVKLHICEEIDLS